MAEPPPPPQPPSPPPSEAPALLSISQLVRLHSRERLLVPPLYWTSRHLDLLGCTFTGPAPCHAPPPPPPPPKRPVRCQRWRLSHRRDALSSLVAAGGPFAHAKNVSFDFNRRHVRSLKCDVLVPAPQRDPSGWPLLAAAYLDLDRVDTGRRNLFRIPRDRLWCRSAKSLSRLKLKRITPRNRLHDPYIVAVLIALAQENRQRVHIRNDLDDVSLFTPRVLVSSSGAETLHLYTARITASYLDGLDDPTLKPSEARSIPIHITAAPFRPYPSLSRRLTALLLPEKDWSENAEPGLTPRRPENGCRDLVLYQPPLGSSKR